MAAHARPGFGAYGYAVRGVGRMWGVRRPGTAWVPAGVQNGPVFGLDELEW